jgi:hypothetical protein
MAKVNYVACPSCHRDYYIEKMLSKALEADPGLMLKCPFCKLDFNLEKKADFPGSAGLESGPAKAGQ